MAGATGSRAAQRGRGIPSHWFCLCHCSVTCAGTGNAGMGAHIRCSEKRWLVPKGTADCRRPARTSYSPGPGVTNPAPSLGQVCALVSSMNAIALELLNRSEEDLLNAMARNAVATVKQRDWRAPFTAQFKNLPTGGDNPHHPSPLPPRPSGDPNMEPRCATAASTCTPLRAWCEHAPSCHSARMMHPKRVVVRGA